MDWKVRVLKGRDEKREAEHGGSNHTPDYGPNSRLFTLRIAYNGLFRKPKLSNLMDYKRGATAYVDFVDRDTVTLPQIHEMLKQIGVSSSKYRLYFTESICLDAGCLTPLENDRDMIGLFCSIETAGTVRCAGLFIDHELKSKEEVCPFLNVSASEEVVVDKGVDVDCGDDGEGDGEKEDSKDEGVTSDKTNGRENNEKISGGENSDKSKEGQENEDTEFESHNLKSKGEFGEGSNGGERCSYAPRAEFNQDSYYCEPARVDGGVSCGEDSEHSDFYVDSDGNYELDDDEDFEKNIDPHIEWVGLQSLKTEEKTGEKKLGSPVLPVRRSKKKPVPHHVPKYKGRKVFDPKVDMEEIFFEHNMCFTSTEILKKAVKKHAVQNCRNIKITMSGTKKFQAKCKDIDCPWFIYASRVPKDNTIVVKTLGGDHDCPKMNQVWHANSKWLFEEIGDTVRRNPSWKVDEMRAELKDKYELDFSRWQMYRLKHLALGSGNVCTEYMLIHRYALELLRSNKGSTVKIMPMLVGQEACFQRLYVCFAALKSGMLEGCRRVILLDGSHLKTVYGGILLTAVGLDGNDGTYPFAYAVVEKETGDSWVWFMKLVCSDLGITEDGSYMWTVKSDKQKGLIEAVKEVMPHAEHINCVYHLYSNFKLLFKGLTLKELVWRAAKCCRPVEFEKIMQQIEAVDPDAYKWLSERPPVHWSKAYFSCMNQTDLILNNLSECLNNLLRDARKLPIIQLLEYIRIMFMNRIACRLSMMLKHKGVICPRIEGILDVNRSWSMKFTSTWNGQDEFQVTGSKPENSWAVNIREKTCSCRRWQLTGIPCGHAISSLMGMKKKTSDYVADCYKKSTYLIVYSHIMHPIHSRDEWPQQIESLDGLNPPIFQNMPGRPKKHARKLGPGERGEKKKKLPVVIGNKLSRHSMEMTCNICHQTGHNKLGCPTVKTSHQGTSTGQTPKEKVTKQAGKPQKKKPAKVNQKQYEPEIGDYDLFGDETLFAEMEKEGTPDLMQPTNVHKERDPKHGKAPVIEVKKKEKVDAIKLCSTLSNPSGLSLGKSPPRKSERIIAQSKPQTLVPQVKKAVKLPIKRKLDVEEKKVDEVRKDRNATEAAAPKKCKGLGKIGDVWFQFQSQPPMPISVPVKPPNQFASQPITNADLTVLVVSSFKTYIKPPPQKGVFHGRLNLRKISDSLVYK